MDHQGLGRTGPAADTRRQASWPLPGSGAHPVLGPGSGAERVLGPGTGPQRLIGRGSGAQPILSPGSGPQPMPGSLGSPGSAGSSVQTPVRGFPPGREQPEPAWGGFSPWHTPREPLTAEDGGPALDAGYGAGRDDAGSGAGGGS